MLAALLGAVLGTAGTLLVVVSTGALDAVGPLRAPLVEASAGGPANAVVAVAEAVTPSVVRIDVVAPGGLGNAAAGSPSGIGSGVIYRSDGYILTNHHVVDQDGSLRVRFADGETATGEVIGSDPLNDLAVVAVERTGLPVVNLRGEPPLRPGETAIAIGSPFGLEASVTAGVVSAVNRELAVPPRLADGESLFIPAVVQTDAAINPGNSGGALVDASGRLVGINTAIFSESGGSQGVGFAIPIASAVTSADQLIEQGFVRHPFLGVTGQDMTSEMARRLGFDAPTGAVVADVVADSGADRGGLREGDVVIALNGAPVESMTDLIVAVRAFAPGDTITVLVVRDDEERRLDVTLGERPVDDLG